MREPKCELIDVMNMLSHMHHMTKSHDMHNSCLILSYHWPTGQSWSCLVIFTKICAVLTKPYKLWSTKYIIPAIF